VKTSLSKVMPNGNIRAYQADKPDKRGVSELQFTNPENESPTVIIGNTIKVIEYMEDQKESKTNLSVIQYPHGFNYGFKYTDGICPAITISSWQHNNFIKYMADKNAIELPSELKGKKF
jgi:hypothetical protein